MAIQYVNSGPQTANDTMFGLGLDIVPNPLSEDGEREVWKRSSIHGQVASGGALLLHSPGKYNSIATPPITSSQAKGLMSGSLQLCATARVIWTDKTGGYCRYSFQCLRREPDGLKQLFFNWHVLGLDYNREEKCKIEALHR